MNIEAIKAFGQLSLGAIVAIILGISMRYQHLEKLAENELRSKEIIMQEAHNKSFEESMNKQANAISEFLDYYTGRRRTDD